MQLKYALTKDDYIAFYRYVTWSSPDRRKKRLYYYIKQVAFSAVIIALMLNLDVFMMSKKIGYMLIAYVLITMIYSILTTLFRINRSAEKFAEDPLNASVFSEAEIQFEDLGIVIKDEHSTTQTSWHSFVKKEETNDHYFLFRNSLDALIIPKRILRIAAEREVFEKMLRTNLSLEAEIKALTRS